MGIFNLIVEFIAVIFLGFLIALFMLPILGDIHHYVIPNTIFHNDLIDEVDSQRSRLYLSMRMASKVDGSMQRLCGVITNFALLNRRSTVFEVEET